MARCSRCSAALDVVPSATIDFLLCEDCVGKVPWVIDLRSPAPDAQASSAQAVPVSTS